MNSRTNSVIRLAIGIGLIYGFVEAAEVMLFYSVPGALSWLTGNTPNVLWLAPVFYGIAFGLIGVTVSLVARLFPRADWQRTVVILLLLLSGFLAASVQGRLASDLTSLIFGLGVAAEGGRQFLRRRHKVVTFILRAIPRLAVATAFFAVATLGGARLLESKRISALPRAATAAPNVLLLVMDTQRADHLSLYGYGRNTSPRIDALAAQSAVFDNASSNSSWTLPAHATLFTGRLPFEHRAGTMGHSRMDGTYETIAEALAQNGYATGGFIANIFWTGRHTGLDRGFIRYEDYYGTVGDAITRTALGRRVAYDILPELGFVDVPGRKRADDLNRSVLSWIDRAGDHPFFAFVNYFDVHTPLLPPEPFAGSYSGMTAAERRAHSVAIKDLDDTDHPPPPEALRQMVDTYDESIRYLDSEVGILLDSLRGRGVLDNTLVIISSDHGESWGEHGLMFHGHSLYRDVTHVPLIIRLPSHVTPGRLRTAVGLNQIPETIGAFTGLPKGRFPGASVFDSVASRDSGVVLQLARRTTKVGAQPASRSSISGLVMDHWQFIEPHSGKVELFDLAADPRGLRDVAATGVNAGTVSVLSQQLRRGDRGRRAGR